MIKNIFIILLYFAVAYGFAQDAESKFTFDYYTVYNYKKTDENSANIVKTVTYSNSKDSSYVLTIFIKNNEALGIQLMDYTNNRRYEFEGNKNFFDLTDLNFLKTKYYRYFNLDYYRKKQKRYHEVDYSNQEKGIVIVNKYKNKKRKKLLLKFIIETTPSEIAQNQHYNFPPLISPMWTNRFTLKNKEVITRAYSEVNGSISSMYQLEEISKIDFTLTVNHTK